MCFLCDAVYLLCIAILHVAYMLEDELMNMEMDLL